MSEEFDPQEVMKHHRNKEDVEGWHTLTWDSPLPDEIKGDLIDLKTQEFEAKYKVKRPGGREIFIPAYDTFDIPRLSDEFFDHFQQTLLGLRDDGIERTIAAQAHTVNLDSVVEAEQLLGDVLESMGSEGPSLAANEALSDAIQQLGSAVVAAGLGENTPSRSQ